MPRKFSPISFWEANSEKVCLIAYFSPKYIEWMIWLISIIRWASPEFIRIFTVASVIEELLHHISVSMAGKVEVSWYSVYFKPSFHSAASIRFEVTLNPPSLLSAIIGLDEKGVIREIVFLDGPADIDFVNFENVFDVQAQHGAWVLGEFNIHIDFEFLI